MKKIGILSILFLGLCIQAFPQFSKGTFLVGGTVGGTFNTDKSKTGSTTTTLGTDNSFTFMPQAGYFVMNNFALGAGIVLSTDTYKANSGGNKTVTTATSFAPFARYYYKNFYGQLTGQFGSGNQKTTSGPDTSEDKYSLSGWSLAIGYAWLLNTQVAVEPQFGYNSTTSNYKSFNDKDIYAGPFLRIALQVYLKK